MNKRFARVLVGLILLTSSTVSASSRNLDQQWRNFVRESLQIAAQEQVSQQTLNQFPQALLLSASQYPDLQRYSWQELLALHHQQKQCPQASQSNIRTLRHGLRQAMVFEQALCQQLDLAQGWFTQAPLLHPAGGSYADRYFAYLQTRHGPNSLEARQFLAANKTRLTLANPQHALHGFFSALSAQGRDALLGGQGLFLSQDLSLWRNTPQGIDRLEPAQWQPLVANSGLTVTAVPTLNHAESLTCALRYSNLCINQSEPTKRWGSWLAGIFGVLCLMLLGRITLERRREAKERQFILQLLTHELRTPIASLGLTVEQFRDGFDQLTTPNQLAFGRLLADYQRLQRLTETSKGFLSQHPGALLQRQSAALDDWLHSCLEPHGLTFSLHASSTADEDQELELPYYWLGICLDNLIRNAKRHGKPPITVTVTVDRTLRIEVQDGGRSPGRWLNQRARTSSTNMGIGLFIVRRLMKKMGGRLRHYRQPTRYVLELPL